MTVDAQPIAQRIQNARHYLHQHPEVSDQEYETTKYLTIALKNLGYRITTPKGLHTGVVAEIGDGKPVVGLRSDIDALPITENTGLNFTSQNHGVMHACGHDFHMASLLGAAELLANDEANLTGTVRIIFQPAEETHVGAEEVEEAGGIDGLDSIIGFHNKPDLGVGQIGLLPGGLMAAVDQFKVVVSGIGTHAAMPQHGKDPIVALSHIVGSLQTVVSRNDNPQDSSVLSVTHIEGGNTWNVIPENAWFEGTVRTFSSKSRELIKQRFYEIVRGEATAFGVEAEIEWIKGPDVVDNNPELEKVVEEESRKHFEVVHPVPSSAGEDFAYFSQRIPSVFAFIGSNGNSDWHHSDLVLDDDGLLPASEWYYYNAKKLLSYL